MCGPLEHQDPSAMIHWCHVRSGNPYCFGRRAMRILADALQNAGCNNDDILNHCRDTNATHVCGCWVLDLVLDKV